MYVSCALRPAGLSFAFLSGASSWRCGWCRGSRRCWRRFVGGRWMLLVVVRAAAAAAAAAGCLLRCC